MLKLNSGLDACKELDAVLELQKAVTAALTFSPKKPVVNRNFNKSANQMSINIKNMKNVMIHTCKFVSCKSVSICKIAERNTIKQSEIRDKCARIGCGKGVKARSPRGFQEKADTRQNSSTIVPIDGKD